VALFVIPMDSVQTDICLSEVKHFIIFSLPLGAVSVAILHLLLIGFLHGHFVWVMSFSR
jgi:hypothetical protein